MSNEELIELFEDLSARGCCEVECPVCGEVFTLEPDGYAECDCGVRVESPLLALAMI